jgi:hypothetical protein
MQINWIATAALAVALIPAAAMAQSKAPKDTAMTNRSTSHQTVTTTSAGDVAGPGSDVTDAMLKEQGDPNLIGSPAWWKNHATADGKPIKTQPASHE